MAAPMRPRPVALTFEAGGSVEPTPAILDTLAERRWPATFFIDGRWAEVHPELVRRIAADGHELGSHGYAHPDWTTLDDDAVAADLRRTEELVRRLVGRPPKPWARPPYGAIDSRVIAILDATGYRAFYRDAVDGAHWPGETTDESVHTRALHAVESEGVVVFHTNSAITASALPTILGEFAHRDCEPVRLSEHPIPPPPRAPVHPDFGGLRVSPGFILSKCRRAVAAAERDRARRLRGSAFEHGNCGANRSGSCGTCNGSRTLWRSERPQRPVRARARRRGDVRVRRGRLRPRYHRRPLWRSLPVPCRRQSSFRVVCRTDAVGGADLADGSTRMTADLLFIGGRILTLDSNRPEVEAVAVTGGRIAAVGAGTDVAALRDHRTRVVELGKRTLLPGFYDAHQHQLYGGLARRNVDGRAPSVDALLARIGDAAAGVTEGAWIEGGGYDERQLAERRAPTRAELDRAAPNHPVLLTRTCGHCMVVNTRALVAAGITSNTDDPPGGVIERDLATRQPSGVLLERAMEFVRKIVPQPDGETLESAILDEARGNLRLGITSVWEPSIEPPHLDAYRRLDRENRLPIRVTMAHKKVLRSGDRVSLPAPFRGGRLSLVAAKLFQDGAIGARTAAVSTGYADDPDNKGVLVWEQPQLDEFVNEIHTSGYQVSVHAIGDVAIGSALEAIERAVLLAPRGDHRHRIEHCGIVASLAPRIARAGVVPSSNPSLSGSTATHTSRTSQTRRPKRSTPCACSRRYADA